MKSILLEELKTTHNVKDWFVPPSIAIAGLTAEQANWKDNTENHSIAQLTTHLIFWNLQMLDKFDGKPQSASIVMTKKHLLLLLCIHGLPLFKD